MPEPTMSPLQPDGNVQSHEDEIASPPSFLFPDAVLGLLDGPSVDVIAAGQLIEYRFADGKAQNADGTYAGTASNVRHVAISEVVPGWGALTDALAFQRDEPGGLVVATRPDDQPMERFGVELVISPAPASAPANPLVITRMNLIEGQRTPFVLYLLAKPGGGFILAGAVRDLRGWITERAEETTIVPEKWTRVGLVYTGDDLVLFVDGQIAARRALLASTLESLGDDKLWIGRSADEGKSQFVGRLAGVRVWNRVPLASLKDISDAMATGVGEIDSKRQELGSWLGKPSGAEVYAKGVRSRSYEGGDVYWSAQTQAHEVHGDILKHYRKLGGPAGVLGLPLTDEQPARCPKARRSRFQKGAIYWSPKTGAHAVNGAIFAHYLRKGAEGSFLGLPVADEEAVGATSGRMSRFQGGTIYWSGATGAFEVHGAILDRYRELGGPSGWLGYPLSDEMDVKTQSGAPAGGKLTRFTGGTMYWSPASGACEVHGAIRQEYERLGGPLGALGYPLTDESGVPGTDIRYNDFQNGIIWWRPSTGPIVLTELELYLGRVVAGAIDDALEFSWDPADRDAEIVTYTTVKANGKTLDDNHRRPGGHAGSAYDLDATYRIKRIHSGTTISLRIVVDDWDEWSDNDHLATLERRFDIKSCFGLAGGSPSGIYKNQPSTEHGGDAPHSDTVRFDFAIRQPSEIDPDQPARAQCWWRFDNFSTGELPRQMFADVFTDVENAEDALDKALHPFDTAYYELLYKGVASKGNCFGMSTEAVMARAGQSLFAEPIYQYKANAGDPWQVDHASLASGLRQQFNEKHGFQLGAQCLGALIDQLANLDLVQPLDVYRRVKSYLSTANYPILSMMDLESGSGHCVMPYRCEDGPGDNPHRIYCADPNVPWRKVSGPDPTWVEVHKDGTFRTRGMPLSFQSTAILGGLVPTTLLAALPLSVVSQQPRTPYADIMDALEFLVGVVLLLAGDAETTELRADGRDHYEMVDGRRRTVAGGIRGLSRIPLLDFAGSVPELYVKRGAVPSAMQMKIKGRAAGHATNLFQTRDTVVEARIPTSTATQDTIELERLRSTRPLLRLATNEKLKSALVKYGVLNDRRGRPLRTYEMALPLAKDQPGVLFATQLGSGVEFRSAGSAEPTTLTLQTLVGDQVVVSRCTLPPFAAGETTRIAPKDAPAAGGTLIVERLTSSDGRVLSRQTVKPQILS